MLARKVSRVRLAPQGPKVPLDSQVLLVRKAIPVIRVFRVNRGQRVPMALKAQQGRKVSGGQQETPEVQRVQRVHRGQWAQGVTRVKRVQLVHRVRRALMGEMR